jgi:Fur family ferric uptake transcriptional regulator
MKIISKCGVDVMTRAPQHSERHDGPTESRPDQGRDPAPDAEWPANDPTDAEQWALPLLRQVRLQVTRPRLLVLAALRGRERPVTAQDLHQELASRLRQSGTGRAVPGVTTVYRALTALADRGVLHCFAQGRAVTAYRLCPPVRHLHLLCRSCGRVQEQPPVPAMERAAAQVTTSGFTVEDYRGELVGLCAWCQPDSARRPG